MEETTRIDLDRDEAVVLHVASQIFSAYVASNQCTRENEEAMLQNSVDLAIRMAQRVDARTSAGHEVKSRLQNDPKYRPLG
jgi:predicted transcriptional regulator